MHVDDWLDTPPSSESGRYAREVVEHFRRPAYLKNEGWIKAHPLYATYKGQRWKVIGASRLGDVWLTEDISPDKLYGYSERVDVEACSAWGPSP